MSDGGVDENVQPGQGPVLGDSNPQEQPLHTEVYKEKKAKNRDHKKAVRRDLAMLIMWVLLITYAIAIGSFILVRVIPGALPANFSAQDLIAVIAGISGLQGLAAAIVGFFFGGGGKNKRRRRR